MRKAMQLFSFLAIIAFVGSYGSAMAQTAAATAAPTPVVTIHGLVDTYFTYDLSNSDYHVNGYGTGDSYDDIDNSVVLGLAELNVGASMGEASAYLSLGYGDTVGQIQAGNVDGYENEWTGSGDYVLYGEPFDVLQAYVTWNPGSWTFKAGKFYTWIGQEVVESNQNWNYSRSYSFQYLDPTWHTGVSASYAFNSNYALTLYMVDGWNSSYNQYWYGDGSGQKSWGFQFTGTPDPSITFNINGLYGYEDYISENLGTGVLEPNITWNVTSALALALDYTFQYQDDGTGENTDSGLAVYAKYVLASDLTLAARGENVVAHYYGSATDLSEATLTLSKTISSNLLTRAEVRYDWATDDLTGKPEPIDNGVSEETSNEPVGQFTGTLSAVYSF